MDTCYVVIYVKGDVQLLEYIFSTLRTAENYIMSEIHDGYGTKMGVKCYLNRGNENVREYWAAEEEVDVDHPHYIVVEKEIDEWKERFTK